MKKVLISIMLLVLLTLILPPLQGAVETKDYKASLFGIKSNGTTLNTRSIQKAIDFIHDRGGGRLVFADFGDPKTFNPVTANETSSLDIIYLMFDGLVKKDQTTQELLP